MTDAYIENYALEPYSTTVDTFDDVSEFVVLGTGTAVNNADSEYIKTGLNSVKVTPDVGTNVQIHKTESLTVTNGRIGLWFYVENHANLLNTGGVVLYFGNDTAITNGFYYTYNPQYNGWHFLQLTSKDWTRLGSGTWESSIERWRLRVNASAGATSAIYFDSWYMGGNGRARGNVLITFDDSAESQYDTARGILNSAGLKATFYTIRDLIGTAGFMSLAELQTLKSDGHSICVHGRTDLTTLSISEAAEDIQSNMDFVASIDPDGSKHYSWPNGGFEYNSTDTQLIEMAQSKGILSARTTRRNGIVNSTIKGLNNPYTLIISGHVNGFDTLQNLKDRADFAYRTGGTVIFMFHKVLTTASETTDISTADFQSFIDHILYRKLCGRIDVLTVPEWYAGLSTGRRSMRD